MKWAATIILLAGVSGLGAAEKVLARGERSGASNFAPIRISGSQTMLTLTRRLTEWYEGRNARGVFELEGGSPTEGFSSLVESKAEIAQSTRKALEGEVRAWRSRRGLEFVEMPVATEFAVIAVNLENPVHALSLFDLRMIFSAQIKSWKQVGGNDPFDSHLGKG